MGSDDNGQEQNQLGINRSRALHKIVVAFAHENRVFECSHQQTQLVAPCGPQPPLLKEDVHGGYANKRTKIRWNGRNLTNFDSGHWWEGHKLLKNATCNITPWTYDKNQCINLANLYKHDEMWTASYCVAHHLGYSINLHIGKPIRRKTVPSTTYLSFVEREFDRPTGVRYLPRKRPSYRTQRPNSRASQSPKGEIHVSLG